MEPPVANEIIVVHYRQYRIDKRKFWSIQNKFACVLDIDCMKCIGCYDHCADTTSLSTVFEIRVKIGFSNYALMSKWRRAKMYKREGKCKCKCKGKGEGDEGTNLQGVRKHPSEKSKHSFVSKLRIR